MFKKILIANRGEIAVRVIRTCKDMGIRTVAIYSDVDVDSLHVRLADEAYSVGSAEAIQSYLNMEKILEIAKVAGAEAIHPGYGFLSENPGFAEMCEQKGITFVGPPSHCMYQVKPKNRARHLMKMLKIPVVPGADEPSTYLSSPSWRLSGGNHLGGTNHEPLMDSDTVRFARLEEIAESIGYPVIIKPAGGGGGIGIATARNIDELENAIRSVEERGKRIFGVSSFYIEKLLSGIKHIEFQVLADKFGTVVYLGERDCSIQRRFQKLIEETPCHILSPHLRMKMAVAALDITVALQYINALTVEFFYMPDTQEFYFNEVNSRLQVEHCVTEFATGIDIVREQIRIAAGERLGYTQDDVNSQGFSIECRINAEDIVRNFLPCPGTVTRLQLPHGLGLRIDEGIYEGYEVAMYYDSLLLKLIAWGKTRHEAISRMKRALDEIRIEGVKTNIPFHRMVLENDIFEKGEYTTDFVVKQGTFKELMGGQGKSPRSDREAKGAVSLGIS